MKLKLNASYILLLLIICILLVCFFWKPNIIEHLEDNRIPKKVWTFWDSANPPEIVNKCIQTWRKHNPNYEIILLNKENILEYLPEVDFSKIKHIHGNSIEKFADMVRIHILSKYGGIWSDASIICLKPFDSWIPQLQEKKNAEFVGFYIDSFTFPEYKEKSPVVENWFFACVQNCSFVKDWLNEFLKISDFDSLDDYVENVKAQGINLQNISGTSYLSMHVACQKVLQQPGANYRIELLKAEDSAFNYLTKNDWKTNDAIRNLLDCKEPDKKGLDCDFLKSPIIKLRGHERREIETQNYSHLFDNT
jgi:hypothetical protein